MSDSRYLVQELYQKGLELELFTQDKRIQDSRSSQ